MNKEIYIGSDFLFARPSFFEGVARLVDFSGALNQYNFSKNGAEADRRAFEHDAATLKEDYRKAFTGLTKKFVRKPSR